MSTKWFKHSATAHDGVILSRILMKYGAEGYAFYWLCVELSLDNDVFPCFLCHDAETIGSILKISAERSGEIMSYFKQEGILYESEKVPALEMVAHGWKI